MIGILSALMFASTIAAAQLSFDGKVDIGGRSIRLSCSGSGGPTVIVEPGMGMPGVGNPAWQRIAGMVSAQARVCLYDRAGLGESSAAPAGPITSDQAVADLELALRAAKVEGPYIFVAHSIGGLDALDYAQLHPDAIAGLVLISSSHPDQVDAWRAAFPTPAADEPAAVSKARDYLARMDKDPSLNPERLDIEASNAQARRLKTVGDKPVIVVTHSPSWKMVPDLPDELNARLEAETQRLQRQFLALSTRSEQRIAKSAGHDLPNEDPDLVTQAILDALAMARSD